MREFWLGLVLRIGFTLTQQIGAVLAKVTPTPINVYFTQHSDALPLWLQVFLGIVACVAGLLLLTCLLLCCMRICGCWTGNILGVGALKIPLDDTEHIGCWCCHPPTIGRGRRVYDENGSYIVPYKNGR